jgi:EmrB/QacA subfamily drug resistance transporter
MGSSRRRWWILAAMTGTLSMILLDQTVVSVALPTIQRDLDTTQTELQWVVNAYLLSLAALVAVGGRLADMFNRVGVLIAGIVLFVCSSAACGLAQSETFLIAARALQGVGAALMLPPTGAIVINTFATAERGKAMGVYAGISMIFLSVGPLIGGLFTDYVSWRWVFWVNLPVGAVTIAMILSTRPEGRVPPGQRLDVPGLLTLVPALAAIVLALMQSNTWGWGSPATVLLLAGGLLLVVAFVVLEWRVPSPLVQLRLFLTRNFRGDTLVLFCIQFALTGITVFGAIYAQDLLGFSPVKAGLALLPLTIPVLIVAPLSGRLYDRVGPRGPVTIGMLLVGVSLCWFAAEQHEFSYGLLVPGYIVAGVGIALVMSPSNTDAMNAAPPELRGQASGVVQTVRQVGGTVGLAIVGTIVANVQHDRLSDFLLGIGEPASQVSKLEGLLAQETETKQSVAAGIPHAEQHQLLAGARDAITDGISVAYWVCGGVMVAAAIGAWAILRRKEYAEEGPPAHPVPPHPPELKRFAGRSSARGSSA